ncbi:MAG TPA: AI-2E family transporter [Candidatus Binatia bacterium]
MKSAEHNQAFQDRAFVFLVIAVSLAFLWILWPFFGAILWGTILAIMFAPFYRELLRRIPKRRTAAAIATVILVLLIVILPLALIGALLLQEALAVYARFQIGEWSFGDYTRSVLDALPSWVFDILDRFGLTNLSAIQERFSSSLMQASQFVAARALDIGQNTLELIVNLGIVLYLLFFLLRDGEQLARRIRSALPLDPEQQRELFRRFAAVIRATVKGNLVVAIAQGALGGLAFWFLGVHAPVLWAVVMAFLSLLPAVGSALVWLPVALYFIATGAVWKGIGLIVYGVVVIGLVDNVLRPLLVGKDTRMPDYIVLIATLGGMAIFGINGFVIGPVIAAMFISVWDIFSQMNGAERA